MQDTTTARLLAHKPQIQRPLRFMTWSLLALGLGIAALPHMPEMNVSHADKYMHMLAFFGFAFLLDISDTRSFWRYKVPILLGYGALIEIIQAFLPWRSFDPLDWVADASGVLLYWLVWYVVLRPLLATKLKP
ncbi:MAG: VanZ family protein [Candidatus Thiocaldithrix dubininis]|uniref:VanZ family protein n=1 Tax=Candidatus Thiocaldithrix dubininis TaxID=3080823 RepID=A0AA95H9V9_9GAMM|nr:MAG: VanZ family protein [Candidatus Thiocaldithrix dubininis]